MAGRVSLKASDRVALIANLGTMLGAGIPILEAVDSMLEDTKGNQRKILDALYADLSQGKQVYASFARFPSVFDPVTVNLLRASEEAGTLETTLVDLREHMERDMEFVDKVKLAFVYPALICVVFVAVVLVMLVVVVPKIATVFSRLKVDLPLPTKVMIFMSDLVTKHPVELGLLFAVILIAFYWILRNHKGAVMRVLFALPVISGLVKNIDLARFTRTMYLLLNSSVRIDQALELAQKVVLRHDMAKIISEIKEMVLAGKQLGAGLRSHKGSVPSMMVKLVEAGEKSGTLEKSMADISKHLDYQVGNSLKSLTAVMEPVLLVLVGLSVGGMMMAIIAPIYSLIGQVNAR